MLDPRDIILGPVETEKSLMLLEKNNKYTFRVRKDANKNQIKEAIEKQFDVKVEKVNTMQVTGKIKRMGRFEGRRPGWKKAIVKLAGDDTIEYFEGV